MSAHPQRQSAPRSPHRPKRSNRSRRVTPGAPRRRRRPATATPALPAYPAMAQRQRQRQQGIALEMGILISVNLVVIAAASTAIVKLIPYNLSQRNKLDVLETEVDSLAQRVDGLRQTFNQTFDPQRTLATQRELGNLALPGQRPVHFVAPPAPPSASDRPGSEPQPAAAPPAPASR